MCDECKESEGIKNYYIYNSIVVKFIFWLNDNLLILLVYYLENFVGNGEKKCYNLYMK